MRTANRSILTTCRSSRSSKSQLPKNVPFLTRNIVMNLQGLRFPESGIYSIDIGCDGEILVRLPLRIVQVTQGPNGETQMA